MSTEVLELVNSALSRIEKSKAKLRELDAASQTLTPAKEIESNGS
jgi:hypothetical protein